MSDEQQRIGTAGLERAEQEILGAGGRYTPPEMFVGSGVDEELVRQLWQAMGFPRVPDDEPALTDRDLDALRHAAGLLAAGIFDAAQLVAQTRIMSQAMSTIATAHVEALGERAVTGVLRGPERSGAGEVLEVIDRVLAYLYRRHLLAALERAGLEPTRDLLSSTVVGFADLTDFSATAARATGAELALLVDDFATGAANLVASAGGRVVKLIGDEVMFSLERPADAVELALTLVETRDGESPPVHVGLALGPVLSHHGDLFGSTVNVASRLSDVARSGTVLVNAEVAAALDGVDGVEVKRVHLRPLKGVGHVDAHVVRRRTDS